MEGSQATQGTLTQATQPSDPGPLQSPKDSAELVVKLLKRKGAADAAITSIEIPKRGELVIGRKATVVDIAVQDQRCSARHIRIYQQSEFGIFIEQLGGNGSFLNSQQLKKGDVRTLQHGDEISVLNYGQSVPDAPAENQPFAVFVFRYAEPTRRSDSYEPRKRLKVEADEACDMMATLGGPGLAGDEGDIDATALSTEEAFQANYDMRIGIDTLIGKGTFSEVRRGVCVRDGQFRAIKVVNRNKFNSFQMLRGSRLSMVHEAELLTSLDHPGIVKCFAWVQTKTSLYLVMELLEGGDLLQNIMKGGCFAESDARRLFRLVCEALSYLHSKDVVHRDLKPDNVLLTSKERSTCMPKIADLGVAATYDSNHCKTICGTPLYFAPELIDAFKTPSDSLNQSSPGYGKTVDMWSLGVVLYILLSGAPPFEADGLYDQILGGHYEFDAEEWETVSSEAKDLVRRLMTVDPKTRPTIQEALKHCWLTQVEVLPASDLSLSDLSDLSPKGTDARGTMLSALGA